jgi:hypothetical protein
VCPTDDDTVEKSDLKPYFPQRVGVRFCSLGRLDRQSEITLLVAKCCSPNAEHEPLQWKSERSRQSNRTQHMSATSLEKWVATARLSPQMALKSVQKAIDDPKVFVFGELLALPSVQSVGVWCACCFLTFRRCTRDEWSLFVRMCN